MPDYMIGLIITILLIGITVIAIHIGNERTKEDNKKRIEKIQENERQIKDQIIEENKRFQTSLKNHEMTNVPFKDKEKYAEVSFQIQDDNSLKVNTSFINKDYSAIKHIIDCLKRASSSIWGDSYYWTFKLIKEPHFPPEDYVINETTSINFFPYKIRLGGEQANFKINICFFLF